MLFAAKTQFVLVRSSPHIHLVYPLWNQPLEQLHQAEASESVRVPVALNGTGRQPTIACIPKHETVLAGNDTIIGAQAQETQPTGLAHHRHQRSIERLGAGPVSEVPEHPVCLPLLRMHLHEVAKLLGRLAGLGDDGHLDIEVVGQPPPALSQIESLVLGK